MQRIGIIAAVAVVVAGLAAAPAQAATTCFGKPATIVGTEGDNDLRGTPGRDVIFAGGGRDVVHGRGGNDLICGGTGEDIGLYGDGGNDRIDAGQSERTSILYGGRGNDFLYDEPGGGDGQQMFGGPGDDVLKAGDSNGTYIDLLDGGPGDDSMEQGRAEGVFYGSAGNDYIYGGKYNGDHDILIFEGSPEAVDVDLAAGTISGWGHDEVDEIEIVLGSGFDDTITGDAERNVLIGEEGDDTISGGAGDDCVLGAGARFFDDCFFPYDVEAGSGDDVLSGGAGDDDVTGGDGNDTITGGEGSDTTWFASAAIPVDVDLGAGTATGDGVDTLHEIEAVVGSNLADTLTGSAERDTLIAGLQGPNGPPGYQGTGGDTLNGLGGNDRLDVVGRVTANGGAGADTVTYEFVPFTYDLVIDLRRDSDTQGNVLSEVENVVAPLHNIDVVIHGDDGPNSLTGGGGADDVFGYGGDDVIDGSYGADNLDGGDGIDTLDGGPDANDPGDTCVNGETVRDCES